MASTWGTGAGNAIPAPTKYERKPILVGSQYTVADGSLVTDSIATKYIIDLEFAGVTNTERGVLEGKFTTYSSAALVIEDETSENVIPIAGSVNTSRYRGITRAYTVTGQVRTV